MSSSPKGLFDEAFIRERCDWSEFEDWASFVADPAHSPEATEIYTGVPAEELRGAARLYARGGNGAIYYGLGVTEHSQGSTTVMAIANLAMATGNIGRPGVGVNPLRGQNNVQGACDMGSFPHELPGYRHISGTEVRDVFESCGAWSSIPNRACASQHARRGRRRHVPRHLHPGRGHPAVRPRHQARQGRAGGDGMRRRP
jgi:predicted molibdopterin-dependent oxidoreductase YjgC